MNKSFHVTSVKGILGKNKANIVTLNFDEQTISFSKQISEKETKTKSYGMKNLSSLVKSETDPKQLSLAFAGPSVTPYKKTLQFQNMSERNLFFDVTLNCSEFRDNGLKKLAKTVTLFKQWDTQANGVLDVKTCAQALGISVDSELLKGYAMVSFDAFVLLYVAISDKSKASQSDSYSVESKNGNPKKARKKSIAPKRQPPPRPSVLDTKRKDVEIIVPHVAPVRRAETSGLDFIMNLTLEPGEVVYMKQFNATRVDGDMLFKGSFVFTNYRLHFEEYRKNNDIDGSIDIPIGWIQRTEVLNNMTLVVYIKQLAKFSFFFDTSSNWVTGLNDILKKEAFPKKQEKCFAFKYTSPLTLADEKSENGWNFYNPLEEYNRIGINSDDPDFRVSSMNLDFSVCSTYPRFLVVPRSMTDEEIAAGAKHRSRCRFPAVCYRVSKTGATLSRCSQPVVGIRGKRCEEDEKLINTIRELNVTNDKILYFMDARPYKAAVGNTVMGKGFENTANYKNTSLHFLNIDNIHVIRNALKAVNEVVKSSVATPEEHASSVGVWLHYIRLILESGVRISKMMLEEGASVVIHCSDGWDRTSQLSALCMIMVDPFHRTRRGFAILIEKEWLSFGHKFEERYGQCDDNYGNEQRAPIFIQFLDCVWQLVRQFPQSFEFNENFLLAVYDHLTSCKFGTFLFDNFKGRYEAQLSRKTASLWTELCHSSNNALYSNPMYRRHEGVVYPKCTHLHLQLWEGMHYRFMINQRLYETQSNLTSGLYGQYEKLRELAKKAGVDVKAFEAKSGMDHAEAIEKADAAQVKEIAASLKELRAKAASPRKDVRKSESFVRSPTEPLEVKTTRQKSGSVSSSGASVKIRKTAAVPAPVPEAKPEDEPTLEAMPPPVKIAPSNAAMSMKVNRKPPPVKSEFKSRSESLPQVQLHQEVPEVPAPRNARKAPPPPSYIKE